MRKRSAPLHHPHPPFPTPSLLQLSVGKALAASSASLPVLLVLVPALRAAVRVTVGVVVEVHFVHGLDGLGQIVLQGRDGRAQRRGAEAVRDEAEVGQTALDARLEDGLRPRVPQWRAVLGQQVCELFADLPEVGEGKGEGDIRLPVNVRALRLKKIMFKKKKKIGSGQIVTKIRLFIKLRFAEPLNLFLFLVLLFLFLSLSRIDSSVTVSNMLLR